MPFGFDISGTGDMRVDIKNALEMVEQWKLGFKKQANWKEDSVNAAVPDGRAIVPPQVIKDCYGVCFLFYVKAGFVFSGELGTGFVITKLNRGTDDECWSGPSAIVSGGMGWGALVGAQKTYHVVFLNYKEAVDTFKSHAKVNFGADISLAAGPVGRHLDAKASVGNKGAAINYSYSYAKGLYGGVGLNGAIASSSGAMNKAFYGHDVRASQLLDGMLGKDKYLTESNLGELYDGLNELIHFSTLAQGNATDKNYGENARAARDYQAGVMDDMDNERIPL
ncbi:hypothetical protein SARC_01569 [Sphaeroforma arctica JP610]|uniref:Ysc84 actin-binding domain-containing protein n=1 Tax=Sphaeroforma arctica JP610 TaxID=667725 RepID=A0A0L0GB50_9EUKA|nr:hypothetical protein SARC_01569 [Sphaeroforma arctica JP610]KNC86247.1 hypothetical protein SARC_01569 [Sphaeroforma arctica JP610]|eukprot:XP_014160149.1 hypothetical protein SARC_01569 [Sphaeroforma arctica JP610]